LDKIKLQKELMAVGAKAPADPIVLDPELKQ
jgi:hypothetical protein